MNVVDVRYNKRYKSTNNMDAVKYDFAYLIL